MARRDVKTDRGMRVSIVECDRKDCTAVFRSMSDPALVEQQLVAEHWILIDLEVRGSGAWEKKILCPTHRPTGLVRGTINGRYWRERAPAGKRDSSKSRVA